jgi:MFS transporter, DHA1 family, multidrug resistance protein
VLQEDVIHSDEQKEFPVATEDAESPIGHDDDNGGPEKDLEKQETAEEPPAQRTQTLNSTRSGHGLEPSRTHETVLTRTSTRLYTRVRFDVEQQLEAQKTKGSIPIAPTKTSEGDILVDWYATDDPANPQNWPKSRKACTTLLIMIYFLSVYGASSMYVASEGEVMVRFGVGHTVASLGLSLFVVGYGLGPLLWAPLSEIAFIGRNLVYVPTFFLFVILSIPTALVDDFAGLMILRFLTAFFGSACLAMGGASIQDMVRKASPLKDET